MPFRKRAVDVGAVRDLEVQFGPEALARIVRSYVTEADADLAALQKSLETDDAAVAARSAHRMASTSAILGAEELAAALRTVEFLGRQGEVAGIRQLIPVVRDAYFGARADLQRLVRAPVGS